METLSTGIFLAIANQKIVDYLLAPVRNKFPSLDLWWAIYIALITGAVLGWLSGINLYSAFLPDIMAGRVLTAITIGGGSSLLHDIFDK